MKVVDKDKTEKVVVSVLALHQKKILLLKRNRDFKEIKVGNGLWDLPGGKAEFGENPEETAIREFEEETGVALDEIKLCGAISYIIEDDVKSVNRINILYFSELKNSINIHLSEEHKEFQFYDKNEIIDLELIREIRTFIIDFMNP